MYGFHRKVFNAFRYYIYIWCVPEHLMQMVLSALRGVGSAAGTSIVKYVKDLSFQIVLFEFSECFELPRGGGRMHT